MEQEVLAKAFGVERADGGMVAHLLGYEPEPQVLPRASGWEKGQCMTAGPSKAGEQTAV